MDHFTCKLQQKYMNTEMILLYLHKCGGGASAHIATRTIKTITNTQLTLWKISNLNDTCFDDDDDDFFD